VLLGVGQVECGGKVMTADEGLARAGLTRIKLAAKEGLALLNGTQISTALALVNLFSIDNLYATALVAGALSVDAAMGSASPVRRAHPRTARTSRADRGREGLSRVARRQSHQLQPSRLRESAGPVQPALPAAGHGRL
jgi:histidine ammonia-lyase